MLSEIRVRVRKKSIPDSVRQMMFWEIEAGSSRLAGSMSLSLDDKERTLIHIAAGIVGSQFTGMGGP